MKKLIILIIFGLCVGNLHAQISPDPWDPADNSPDGATQLEIPQAGSGSHGLHSFTADDTDDWFVYSLDSAVLYEFSTQGGIDINAELYASDAETVVVSARDAGFDGSVRFTFVPESSGTFYLRIWKTFPDEEGEYTLFYVGDDGSSPGDEWDPEDDSPFSATALTLSDTEQTHGPHSLGVNDNEDWFRFAVAEGDTLAFRSDSGGDLVGELYRNNGLVRIAADDNGGEILNFDLRYTAMFDGELWLRITLGEDEARADYSLIYQSGVDAPPTGDEWDPTDDIPEGATNLGTPSDDEQTHGPHTLSAFDTADYFLFTLESGSVYEFFTTGPSNLIAELLLPDGVTQVGLDFDSGEGENIRLVANTGETGKLLLHLREFANGDAEYTLHYRRIDVLPEPPLDEWDPVDDDRAGATPLPAPLTQEQSHESHTLSLNDVFDWFQVELAVGDTLELWTSGDADTIGALFEGISSETPVIEADSGGIQDNFRLSYTAGIDGTLYFRIRQFDPGATGSYALHYRLASAPPLEGDQWDPADDSPEGATPLAPASVNGFIHGPHRLTSDDSDWFEIVIGKSEFYEFFSTGDADTTAELYLPDGVTLAASDQDGGDNANFRLAYRAEFSGAYLLKISEELGAEGVYDLLYFSDSQSQEAAAPLASTIYRLADESEFAPEPGGFDNAPEAEWAASLVPASSLLYGDGDGVVISADPGEVMMLQFAEVDLSGGLMLLRASVRTTDPGAQIWLAAIDGSFDGSASSTMILDDELFVDGYRRVTLLYDSPSGSALPIVQVANSGTAPVTAYLDTLEVYTLPADQMAPAELLDDSQAESQIMNFTTLSEAFSLISSNEYTEIPGGFDVNPETGEAAYPGGDASAGQIPADQNRVSDEQGVTISAEPGQVHLLTFPTVSAEGPVLLRAKVRSTGPGAQVGLAALDSSLNGSIAANIPADSSIYQTEDSIISVLIEAPNGGIVPVIQLANLPGETGVSLHVDEVEVYRLADTGAFPLDLAN